MSRTVLVVEDDASIETLLEAVLRHDGAECLLAGDGEAALRLIARAEFDAIVLDLLLPGVNGFEVLRHLSATRPELLARTVVITAAAESTFRDSAELKSVRSVLTKPLDIDVLCAEVRACANAGDGGPRPTAPRRMEKERR